MWLYWRVCFIFKSSFLLFTNKILCGRTSLLFQAAWSQFLVEQVTPELSTPIPSPLVHNYTHALHCSSSRGQQRIWKCSHLCSSCITRIKPLFIGIFRLFRGLACVTTEGKWWPTVDKVEQKSLYMVLGQHLEKHVRRSCADVHEHHTQPEKWSAENND